MHSRRLLGRSRQDAPCVHHDRRCRRNSRIGAPQLPLLKRFHIPISRRTPLFAYALGNSLHLFGLYFQVVLGLQFNPRLGKRTLTPLPHHIPH
jgi:hypothetical protein